ncbi:MSHA biogenesis protein mshP [Vibrio ishigakensis]|uniref:MSHA biogenesis protein mshP n=1 Tax=Vibrio ishigakensis TaxID=1481914 RepID=A0A0B8PIR0_9VIBR|nr:MSHA biogenesis protein mshP [Vibrio ishigakensis]
MFRNRNPKAQQGNVYIVAIFVIVVMGMLALSMLRISWSNQDTLTRELLGNQASLLARSANEWGLTHLFPLNASESFSDISARCSNMSSSAGIAAGALVNNAGVACSAPVITCESPASGVPDDLRYFRLNSVATCNDGNIFEVQREQTVWVKGIRDE